MLKPGRNDPCPCGSGRKFKKCHLGREAELTPDGPAEITAEMSAAVTGLVPVDYGRSREMAEALDIRKLTGSDKGIRFVDLRSYLALDIAGGAPPQGAAGRPGGVFINLYKTVKTDPDHVYLAISPEIDDSTLVHELAHVLDYLGGSNLMPGTLQPLSFETEVPVDHLEHTQEFGYWLDHLRRVFAVELDADDTVILYLYQNGMLLRAREISEKSRLILKSKSERIFRFLGERSGEIDALIRSLPGYIGRREARDDE